MGANNGNSNYGYHSRYEKSRKYQLCGYVARDNTEQGKQLLKEWEELFLEKCRLKPLLNVKGNGAFNEYMIVLSKLSTFQKKIVEIYNIKHIN